MTRTASIVDIAAALAQQGWQESAAGQAVEQAEATLLNDEHVRAEPCRCPPGCSPSASHLRVPPALPNVGYAETSQEISSSSGKLR